jgi:Arylsulfotransferase (ASST)
MEREGREQPGLEALTRRQLLYAAGVMAIGGPALAAGRASANPLELARAQALPSKPVAPHGSARIFRSLPDLRPPTVTVTGAGGAPGYLLIGPEAIGRSQAGPLVTDEDGEPVWFRPLPHGYVPSNVAIHLLGGEPVLAWWQGRLGPPGYGYGEGVVVDRSYRELYRVRAANGRQIDLHELQLTAEGTALFTCTPQEVTADLSAFGGPQQGRVLESVIQEVDIRTGSLLLEWRSLEHIPVTDSMQPISQPFDYLHANSIAITSDGNLLVSARHSWTVYKLDRRTGEVIWRLGGKHSDYALGPGVRFAYQHDARPHPDGSITLFDDGADYVHQYETESRAIRLELDDVRRSARLAAVYRHPKPLLSVAMGSVQTLAGGHVLVGWGTRPFVSEFAPDGRLLIDVQLPSGVQSYRAYRLPWVGKPADAPTIATRHGSGRRDVDQTIYASWNGSTEVAHWRVETGSSPSALRPIGTAPRRGFETAIPIGAVGGHLAVTALGRRGETLGQSRVVRV